MRHKDKVHNLEIADIDVGGDVHRIILAGINKSPGKSALEIREMIMTEYDDLRPLLISPPYGQEDMCADILFASDHPEASYGYVIMESMGYPYYSGSNTIATIAALLEYEILPTDGTEAELCLEAPGGLVTARYTATDDGRLESGQVKGDPAYVISERERTSLNGFGEINYSLVWSGGYFVLVNAQDVGVTLTPDGIPRMKEIGFALTETLIHEFQYDHPEYGRIDSPKFVHFMGAFEQTGPKIYRGQGATFGHPNTVWNCPTGTGTSARMALMVQQGKMEDNASLEYKSATGNIFTGHGIGAIQRGDYTALQTAISARPYVLATTTLHIDFDNPLMRPYLKLKEIMAGTTPSDI